MNKKNKKSGLKTITKSRVNSKVVFSKQDQLTNWSCGTFPTGQSLHDLMLAFAYEILSKEEEKQLAELLFDEEDLSLLYALDGYCKIRDSHPTIEEAIEFFNQEQEEDPLNLDIIKESPNE